MKITREALKNIVKETMIEESEYQEFFKRALEKAGKSIPSMSDEEKKKFFNNIEKTWKGKGAKQEQVSELTDAQKKLPPALQKAIEKKDGKDESTDKKEEVKESIIKEGFATWEMSFSDMNLNGVKLSKKNKYKVKARNTVEAIKKAAKMAGLKGNDWIATQTNYLKKIG
jgi:nucleoid-associated protein YgaU